MCTHIKNKRDIPSIIQSNIRMPSSSVNINSPLHNITNIPRPSLIRRDNNFNSQIIPAIIKITRSPTSINKYYTIINTRVISNRNINSDLNILNSTRNHRKIIHIITHTKVRTNNATRTIRNNIIQIIITQRLNCIGN